MNPNNPSISIDAFNVVPGIAFLETAIFTEGIWVAMDVSRDVDRETVTITARLVKTDNDPVITTTTFLRDFCDEIDVVGVSANPGDVYDHNIGTSLR